MRRVTGRPTESPEDIRGTVALAGYALSRARTRPEPAWGISLLTSLSELVAWLADEQQLTNAFAPHWASLVDDLRMATAGCGPALCAVVVDGYEQLEVDLVALRAQLREMGGRGVPDRALLRRLDRIAGHITERSSGPRARRVALDDLIDASSTDDLALAEDRARTLADLGRGAGWPPDEFAYRLRSALQDGGKAAIANAKRVAGHEEPCGDRIVWLRYRVATLRERHVITVGQHVTLLDGDWLTSALTAASSELLTTAPELATNSDRVESLAQHHGDAETGEEQPPFVVARIELTGVRRGEALDRARQTAQTLAALGVLYGSDPGVWTLDPSYVVYADGGEHASSSVSAEAETRLPAYAALALQRDSTAETLLRQEKSLGPHLPVSDAGIAEAARLLHWLQQAQLTAAPPRLLLCDRVLEQVRGWAGVGELRRFVYGDLRLPRVRRQMLDEITTAAWQSLEDLTRCAAANETASLFAIGEPGRTQTIDVPRFLVHLDEIAAAVEGLPFLWNPALPLRLAGLRRRSATKRARRAWLSELIATFDRAEARRLRTRNLLIHGGPLSVATIDAVVGFAEGLAFHALGESIEGRLEDADLVDHFLARREECAGMQRAINSGQPLDKALFSSTGGS